MKTREFSLVHLWPTKLSLAIGVAATAVVSAGAPVAFAQSGFSIEEIVVTARKREESLQETPIAITALGAEDLARRQITGTDDIDKVAPNIQFASHGPLTGNSSAAQVFIRGIGQTDATASVDPGVGLYIDDVYMGTSVGGSMDFRDISNIQVVRGPQGTLFGRNTIGGAVLLTTENPGEELAGSVKLGGGSDSLVEFNGAVDVPIHEDFLTRFTYGTRKRDGYVDQSRTGADLGDDDTYTFTAKAVWTPSDSVGVTFKYDHTEEDENGVPYVFAASSATAAFPAFLSTVAGCPGATFPPPSIPQGVVDGDNCINAATFDAGEFANNGTVIPESTLENSGFSAVVDWDVNNALALKYVGSIRETQWSGTRDADNTPFVILHTNMVSDNEQSSHELQLNFTGDNFKGVVGAFYYEAEADEVLTVNFTPPAAPVIPVNNGALLDTESWALFGQATYDFTERLSLTLGLRYTEETKDIVVDAFGSAPAEDENGLLPSFGLTDISFPTVVGTRYVNQDLHSLEVDDTSGHLNLQYKLDSATLYASYSEAFKSGGWNPLYNAVQPANGLNIGDVQTGAGDPTAFNPEFAETIEVGFKWDPTDNFRLNGAIFSTDYKDLQLTNRVGIVPLLFNAGEAGIDGMELEFTFTPSSKWIVEGSVGYLDGSIESPVPIVTREVVDGVITEVVATQTVSAGNDTPYSPDLMANVGVSYILDLDGWSLTPRIDINYVDSQFFDAGNTVEIAQIDEQTTARFALTLDSDNNNWRAVAGIENLTDEVYPVAGNSSLATATGYAEVVYSRPRVYYFNVEYSF